MLILYAVCAYVQFAIHSVYIENITRRCEDMNFIFEWRKQYFTNERSEWVKHCFHHEKIKLISSNCRVTFCLLYSGENNISLTRTEFHNCVIIYIFKFLIYLSSCYNTSRYSVYAYLKKIRIALQQFRLHPCNICGKTIFRSALNCFYTMVRITHITPEDKIHIFATPYK